MIVDFYIDLINKYESTTGNLTEQSLRKVTMVSIEALKTRNKAAYDVLEIISFFSCFPIPFILLRKYPSRSLAYDVSDFNSIIVDLQSYKLAEVENDSIVINRDVQEQVRGLLSNIENCIYSAIEIIDNSLPRISESSFSDVVLVYDALAPHAIAVAEHGRNSNINPVAVARLFNDVGMYNWMCGNYDFAKQYYLDAINTLESSNAYNTVALAVTLNNLGRAYDSTDDLHKARDCFERALSIDEECLGYFCAPVARDINNVGGALARLGEYDKAAEAFQRSINIDETVFGEYHPEVAVGLNNLGRVYYDLRDLGKAQAVLERALDIDMKAFGEKHPNVAIRLINLGTVYAGMGNLGLARTAYSEALTVYTNAYGENHPDVAMVRAKIFGLQGRLKAI